MPASLVQAHYIDRLADLLEECVDSGLSAEQFKTRLLKEFALDQNDEEDGVGIAVELYEQLLDLERQQINGIWARIIKNAFGPLSQGRFDYVAGNPPWVNWESLPGDYREMTKPLWVHHGLFPHTGMDVMLGKGKKDISMLMTYVAMDNYLRQSGTLGFIITQTVFKTSGAGQGFRRFVLGSHTPVRVIAVDDMVDLQPFEGASNRTAVLVLRRGAAATYPVSYGMWRKTVTGRSIAEDLSLDEVREMSSMRQFVAQPIEQADATSPWLSGPRRAVAAAQQLIGPSDYRAYEGANTGGANGVYWLESVATRPDGLAIMSNLTAGAKRQVESVQVAIERDLLYPLLRGRDVLRWQAAPEAHILMVQDPNKRRGYDESWLAANYPRAYGYLTRFRDVLLERKDRGTRGLIDKGAPFYTFFGVGDYTLSPNKVVWREVAYQLDAAVSEQVAGLAGPPQPTIPDHTLIYVPCNEAAEAHYLCASLNSAPSRFVVQNYIVLHPDPHVMERVAIPRYDGADPVHGYLAECSEQAHEATAAGDTARVKEIEEEIDRLAAKLWGLTDAELKEIQESLAELG